jgi:hypothetical protein
VRDPGIAGKVKHIACTKYVAYQATSLVHLEIIAIGGHDTGRVLSPMLQYLQPVVQQLVHR